MNLGGLETNYQEILLSDNPGQNIWDNSRFPLFPLFPHYNAVHTIKICSSIARMFQHCLGERGGGGGGEQGSERTSRVGNITMKACTVNSLLFAQRLTNVPNCFDPDCRIQS